MTRNIIIIPQKTIKYIRAYKMLGADIILIYQFIKNTLRCSNIFVPTLCICYVARDSLWAMAGGLRRLNTSRELDFFKYSIWGSSEI